MKKLLIIFILAITQISYSQNNFEYGLKIGGIYNYDSDLTRNNFGFLGGGFANIKLNDNFKMQGEILYAKYSAIKGYDDVEVRLGTTPGTIIYPKVYEVNKKVIQVPIIGQYNFTKPIFLEFGPQFGYIMDGDLSFRENDNDHLEDEIIVKKMESQFDFGVIVGLGYSLTNSLDTTIRHYFGMVEKDNIITLGIALKVK